LRENGRGPATNGSLRIAGRSRDDNAARGPMREFFEQFIDERTKQEQTKASDR
jgi:hypothetical protein